MGPSIPRQPYPVIKVPIPTEICQSPADEDDRSDQCSLRAAESFFCGRVIRESLLGCTGSSLLSDREKIRRNSEENRKKPRE